jgi:NMD protein affecting ribosome stability and mRNA decay
MKQIRVSCPKCGWAPDGGIYWMCSDCKTKWNTFDTRGRCPGCGRSYQVTSCPKKIGCGQISPHEEWYEEIEIEKPKSIFSAIISRKKESIPITSNDRRWVEQSLLLLAHLFEPVYFKSLSTITPDKENFDREFTGTEQDADFILARLISIIEYSDGWEIQLINSIPINLL